MYQSPEQFEEIFWLNVTSVSVWYFYIYLVNKKPSRREIVIYNPEYCGFFLYVNIHAIWKIEFKTVFLQWVPNQVTIWIVWFCDSQGMRCNFRWCTKLKRSNGSTENPVLCLDFLCDIQQSINFYPFFHAEQNLWQQILCIWQI